MRVIFLDIDGVLNSEMFYRRRAAGQVVIGVSGDISEIDPEAMTALNTLVSKTGAKVVISSTWRHGRLVASMQKLFFEAGFIGEIIGFTPDMRARSVFRGNEIHRWIVDNEKLLGKSASEYREYVILDDDSDMLYWQRNNFVLIDGHVGLTPTMAYRAAKVMGVTI